MSHVKLPELDEEKRKAIEQWGANPCGAHVASELEFGTREYFETIRTFRYTEYAPWMHGVIGFKKCINKRLLEIGCGTGTDLTEFARAGADVTGVDLTPKSIEIAFRRFEVYGLAGDFVRCDGEDLPFADSSFDVVYSFGVLHHTPDTEKGIREIRRVLRPGGGVIVMLYNRTSLRYWVGLILRLGLLRGELFRMETPELLSKYVEYSETGGRPLVKVFSKREARRIFRDFKDVNIHVRQLTRAEFKFMGRLIPEWLLHFLGRSFGWNLIITATK